MERRGYDESADSDDEVTTQKEPRVTWTAELYAEFINAVNQLGLDRAVPKKILDIMNIPGLSRENVASHLQKYRRGLKRNVMGLSEHFDTDAGTSGYAGSSDFLILNSRCPAISFENSSVNGCKTMSTASPDFLVQQSHSGHTAVLPSWFTRPSSHQNSLGQNYAINAQSSQVVTGRQHPNNSHINQLVTENPDILPNSLVMNAPTQASNDSRYWSFHPRLNQLNSYTQTCQIPSPPDGNSFQSSAHQLGYAADGKKTGTLFDNSILERCDLDDSLSIELNTVLPLEQKQQQFSACSGVGVEMEALINSDLVNAYININENLNHRSPYDLTNIPSGNSPPEIIASLNDVEFEDDLHAALKQ